MAVTALIIVGVAAVAWITIRQLQVERTVFAGILERKLTETSRLFRAYLQPVNDDLAAMDGWWQSGLLDPTRPENAQALLTPLLAPHQQIVAAYVIPPQGTVFQLVRKGEQWQPVPATAKASDVRQSAWYERASQADPADPVVWSDYRALPGLADQGILIGQATTDGIVLALAILKSDLDRFAATAPITENGLLVRRFRDGRIAWLGADNGGALDTTDSGELLVGDRPEYAVISNALLSWGRRDKPYEQAFAFKTAGQTWWASCFPSEPGTDPGELFLIASVGDLSQRLESVTGRVMALFGVVLALAVFAIVVLAFDYRRKWQRVARRKQPLPESEAELRDLIAAGESNTVEFKATLRWNLHADKAGKEMELAWLKTVVAYLNTAGGFLLIGVADDGEVLGTAADKFPNEDKFILHFDNLIQQHIGLQFAGWIHGGFRSLGDLRVFLISCDRCEDPVFLRKGDEEQFYIRVGASSRQLPGSRIFDYLEERNR